MYTLELTHYNGEITYPCTYKNAAVQCYELDRARVLKKRDQAQQLKAFILKKDSTISNISIIKVER